MLNRISELMKEGKNFAFETTLATKSHKERVEVAQAIGYHVVLLFFWLRSVDLAKERVKTRVLEGGHNVEELVIERRYNRGIVNLFELFLPLSDEAMVLDNSEGLPILIAEKSQRESSLIINNEELFSKLKEHYENRK
jgi:predicted ABC-type ATPase